MKSKIIIDVATLFQEKNKKRTTYPFFAPNVISSLSEFSKCGYQIQLLYIGNKNNNLLSWGKDFLRREKVIVSLISLNKFKEKINHPSQNEKTIYALTPKISETFKAPKSTSKNKILFFMISSTVKGHYKTQSLKSKDWFGLTQEILHPLRRADIHRKTTETDINLQLNLDGTGRAKIKTGLGFFDHMLTNFCKHSGVDITLTVKGDLEVDEHHTIEDTALALGKGICKALGDKRGLERYGFVLPMDESEASCSIDLSGRSHLEWDAQFKREYVGDFPTEMLKHFYNSLCLSAGLNMNMKITGDNEHHLIESSFKSFARCLNQAIRVTGRDIPSTKGSL